MRIVKDPKERKREIMDMAAQLFMNQGYEETSVNMIVEQLGVAKGTFYHYFKSKEQILEAVLEDYLDKYAEHVKAVSENDSSNAYEKLMFILKNILSNNQGPTHLTKHVEDNKNARLHQVLDEKFHERFNPIIVDVIKQGIDEGIFKVDHPEEITEILLLGIRAYMHIHIPNFGNQQYLIRKLQALEELFNKVLDMDEKIFAIKLV
ncbi:MAG: TetR family transcriptional regulator [Clostridia bacterium]|jgi:AcrR family transcriptional regulator|nr:TetR family transcriptional regulator [Clostridia bacterium]